MFYLNGPPPPKKKHLFCRGFVEIQTQFEGSTGVTSFKNTALQCMNCYREWNFAGIEYYRVNLECLDNLKVRVTQITIK